MLTTCVHSEQIQSLGKGIEAALCTIYGQARRIDPSISKSSITKLGHVNGAVVKPEAVHLIAISTMELLELKDAELEGWLPDSKQETKAEPPVIKVRATIEEYINMHSYDKSRYLKDHKDELIACVMEKGIAETNKIWGTLHSTWSNSNTGLIKKWHLDKNKIPNPETPAPAVPVPSVPAKVENHSEEPKKTETRTPLPLFPAFNENWEREVKVAWLSSYAQLRAAGVWSHGR